MDLSRTNKENNMKYLVSILASEPIGTGFNGRYSWFDRMVDHDGLRFYIVSVPFVPDEETITWIKSIPGFQWMEAIPGTMVRA